MKININDEIYKDNTFFLWLVSLFQKKFKSVIICELFHYFLKLKFNKTCNYLYFIIFNKLANIWTNIGITREMTENVFVKREKKLYQSN